MGNFSALVSFEKAGDANLLADCNREIQELHCSLYPEEFRPWEQAAVVGFFAEALEWDNHFIYIIRAAGEAVGYLWYELRQRRDHPFKLDTDVVFVHQVSVNTSHRGRGIGRRAMAFIEERARAVDSDRIMLDYWEGNPAAAFYEKLGFRTVNRVVVRELPD